MAAAGVQMPPGVVWRLVSFSVNAASEIIFDVEP